MELVLFIIEFIYEKERNLNFVLASSQTTENGVLFYKSSFRNITTRMLKKYGICADAFHNRAQCPAEKIQ